MSKTLPLNNCTPRIPKMMKNVQQINTIFPIGLKDESNVCTTNFSPGARLITLRGRRDRRSRKTLRSTKTQLKRQNQNSLAFCYG